MQYRSILKWNFVDICFTIVPDQISNSGQPDANCINDDSYIQSEVSVARIERPTAAESVIDINNDGPDESTEFLHIQNTVTHTIEHTDGIDLIYAENERTELTFYVHKPFVFTKND
jgi:hypothetical protein